MDLKFKEYYQDNHQQSGIQYPKPLTGAGIGGYLGYAFGGPVGGALGAAAGYGIGKLTNPKSKLYDNPHDYEYVRQADGTISRYMPPEEDLTDEQAAKINANEHHPYFYIQLRNGKWKGIIRKNIGNRQVLQQQQAKVKPVKFM